MKFRALFLRNLRFHWRGHLAVLLGVALGSAVLTGALLVGDSLRGSLQDRADRQRCGVEYALLSPKFFNADISRSIESLRRQGILLHGSLYAGDELAPRFVSGVTI